MTAPKDDVNYLLDTFNNYDNKLKFTLEVQHNNKLNFLDIGLIQIDDNIITDWYHKPSFSGRYLNYHSSHHVSHKISTNIGLVDSFTFITPDITRKKL